MHIAIATLESVPGSHYSPSRCHETPKLTKEGADDYEKRTWREKAHYDESGIIYIPPMCFKNAVADAANMLGLKIPGKGNALYTKHFLAGVQVFEPLPLGIHKDKAECVKVHCNADGKRGSGKRVFRYFPDVPKWAGKVQFMVVDSTITEDVFLRHLQEAGMLVGVGRWRAKNGGLNGRFVVKKLQWKEYATPAAA